MGILLRSSVQYTTFSFAHKIGETVELRQTGTGSHKTGKSFKKNYITTTTHIYTPISRPLPLEFSKQSRFAVLYQNIKNPYFAVNYSINQSPNRNPPTRIRFSKGEEIRATMANLPNSLNMNAPFGGPGGPNPTAAGTSAGKERKLASAEHLVLELSNPELRENALLELSKKREHFQDLAPLLWNSFGTIAALLQEIVSIYPVLSPPALTPAQSNRVCNALALLQCVASHPDTRMLFLNAHIPLYLYPFLNTTNKSRPFEYLRLTSLGVIGALVKVATFIVQKILLDDVGLDYICTTAERFFAVGRVLGNMVAALAEQPSSRLLKHIIRCYLRLSDNLRACDALRSCLPDMLRDATFSSCLREDPTTRRWLQQLLHNVGVNRVPSALQPGGGFEHMLVN
ncbi:CCR4-NOT transcription complex subunit 9 [Linum perenne]